MANTNLQEQMRRRNGQTLARISIKNNVPLEDLLDIHLDPDERVGLIRGFRKEVKKQFGDSLKVAYDNYRKNHRAPRQFLAAVDSLLRGSTNFHIVRFTDDTASVINDDTFYYTTAEKAEQQPPKKSIEQADPYAGGTQQDKVVENSAPTSYRIYDLATTPFCTCPECQLTGTCQHIASLSDFEDTPEPAGLTPFAVQQLTAQAKDFTSVSTPEALSLSIELEELPAEDQFSVYDSVESIKQLASRLQLACDSLDGRSSLTLRIYDASQSGEHLAEHNAHYTSKRNKKYNYTYDQGETYKGSDSSPKGDEGSGDYSLDDKEQ